MKGNDWVNIENWSDLSGGLEEEDLLERANAAKESKNRFLIKYLDKSEPKRLYKYAWVNTYAGLLKTLESIDDNLLNIKIVRIIDVEN